MQNKTAVLQMIQQLTKENELKETSAETIERNVNAIEILDMIIDLGWDYDRTMKEINRVNGILEALKWYTTTPV